MENIEQQNKFKSVLQKRNIYTKNDAGAVFLLAVIVPQIIGTVFVILLMTYCNLAKKDYTVVANQTLPLVLLTAISQLSFVGIFFGYNAFMHINTKKACRLDFNIGAMNFVLAMGVGIVALFGFNNIITSFDALLKLLGHTSASMPLPLDNGWWLCLNIFLLAVLPAIFEELLFRGIILNGLRQYGRWTAIFVSALLFALIHGNVDQMIYPFLLGFVFAIIADRTSSTLPTILAHFVNNCIVIVINYICTINNVSQTATVDLKYVLLSILFAVLASATIVGLIFCLKREEKEPENDQSTDRNDLNVNVINQNDLAYFEKVQSKPNTFLWIGIAIGCAIWIFNLLV